MGNFWKDLPRPFLVLAPMDDVTDNIFRDVVAFCGRPDVFMTEFVNVDGLTSGGFEKVVRKLKYNISQHPIVAQLWGKSPDNFYKSAKIVRKMGFDGIDINMGCPIKDVVKIGCGAGLIGNNKLVGEIIKAVKGGSGEIPVSVKTRLGNKLNIANKWIAYLLKQDLSALTIHARTAVQMSTGFADWGEIRKAVTLKNKISPATVIIGNGDIKNYKQALEMHKKHGVDGVMIGRGIFSNPWVFEKKISVKDRNRKEYIRVLLKHLELYDRQVGGNFQAMKKYFKMYVNNFDGAGALRQRLMECKNSSQVRKIILSR